MQRQTLAIFLVTACATAAIVVGAVVWMRNTASSQARISLADFRVPAQFTEGMVNFITAEESDGKPDTSLMLLQYPAQQAGLWGYYVDLIDQEPWKTRLVEQHSATGDRIGWPPLPLEGAILDEPQFRGRILELYTTIMILPDRRWGIYQLNALHLSSSARRGVAKQACDYGERCCMFWISNTGSRTPQQLQRVWQWQEGRIVISISTLGAPDWPITAAIPLIEHYMRMIPRVRGVHASTKAEAPPSDRLVEC
jgi:hypothetical protein